MSRSLSSLPPLPLPGSASSTLQPLTLPEEDGSKIKTLSSAGLVTTGRHQPFGERHVKGARAASGSAQRVPQLQLGKVHNNMLRAKHCVELPMCSRRVQRLGWPSMPSTNMVLVR